MSIRLPEEPMGDILYSACIIYWCGAIDTILFWAGFVFLQWTARCFSSRRYELYANA
jgi:hypothetical protein